MTNISDFSFARIPEIQFGPGKLALLPRLIARHGKNVLLVTGSGSFARSPRYQALTDELAEGGGRIFHCAVSGEPSPEFVDASVERHRAESVACVVGIGGGSALDAGKAISAMLLQDDSVVPYLECVDSRKHDGRKVPYIAVPTSSGTGAEATKNAVLSNIGADGYKSSLRHDNFVPDVALLDPELTLTCPADVTAACGLDALTQLLEAYVSSKASPMTDALALSGLQHLAAGFLPASLEGLDVFGPFREGRSLRPPELRRPLVRFVIQCGIEGVHDMVDIGLACGVQDHTYNVETHVHAATRGQDIGIRGLDDLSSLAFLHCFFRLPMHCA